MPFEKFEAPLNSVDETIDRSKRNFLKATGLGLLAAAGLKSAKEASASVMAMPGGKTMILPKTFERGKESLETNEQRLLVLREIRDEDIDEINSGRGLKKNGVWIVVPDDDAGVLKAAIGGAVVGTALAGGVGRILAEGTDDRDKKIATGAGAAFGAVVGSMSGGILKAASLQGISKCNLIEGFDGLITRELINSEIKRLEKTNDETRK